LGVPVARLLRRATRRVALDDEQLGVAGVLHGAVGELPRKGGVLERGLAAGQVARLARGFASARGVDGLLEEPAPLARVLLQELAELPVHRLLDQTLDRRVAELGLGLALELRIAQLDRDHR